MASANLAFKMPQEPRPLPSLEGDEESFVVLGTSLPDFNSDEYVSSPVDISVIAEAKKLINSELEALEQKDKPEEKNESLESTKMETSTTLPAMPDIEKGIESMNTISIVSFSADMSSEEVQNKISQIIDENIRLKDTILQNSMTLKKILVWQEDVQRVNQTHKAKLAEAKNFIDNLKMEKENLKRDFIKASDTAYNLEAEIAELKRALKEKETVQNEVLIQRSDDNIKEFQLDVANKKIKDLETEIEKLTAENKKYIDDVAKVQENDSKKVNDLQTELEKLTLRENEKQENIKKLEPELQKLIKERDYFQEQLAVKTQREESLTMSTNTLKAQLEMANKSEEVDNLRKQLAETQLVLTQMEFSRAQAYSQVNQLTEQLSKVPTQGGNDDEICALKLQVDVYKSDFEEERNAREVIKDAKDRLEEDIQNLQRRNQQLQEEIEMLRNERDYVVYPSRSAPTRRERVQESRSSTSSNESSSFKCPKCDFGFNNMSQLQNHVYKCIELDDNLP